MTHWAAMATSQRRTRPPRDIWRITAHMEIVNRFAYLKTHRKTHRYNHCVLLMSRNFCSSDKMGHCTVLYCNLTIMCWVRVRHQSECSLQQVSVLLLQGKGKMQFLLWMHPANIFPVLWYPNIKRRRSVREGQNCASDYFFIRRRSQTVINLITTSALCSSFTPKLLLYLEI